VISSPEEALAQWAVLSALEPDSMDEERDYMSNLEAAFYTLQQIKESLLRQRGR
jgi:hypothetical protein